MEAIDKFPLDGIDPEYYAEWFLRGLSNTEILKEIEGEEVPLRTVGFIKRRRKEFEAYRKIIEEAFKRGDTTTRKMFEEIVAEEEEHYWQFDDFLK